MAKLHDSLCFILTFFTFPDFLFMGDLPAGRNETDSLKGSHTLQSDLEQN